MVGRKFAEKIVDVKRIVDDTLTDRERSDLSTVAKISMDGNVMTKEGLSIVTEVTTQGSTTSPNVERSPKLQSSCL